MFDRFEDGLLTPAETASYLGIPHAVLCSWLGTRAAGAALVHQVERACEGRPSVPFVAVAEAHVLRSLRFLGLRHHLIWGPDDCFAPGGVPRYLTSPARVP